VSPPRFVVWDLDGTLVDSCEDLCRAVNHALREVGLPERTLAEVASYVGEGAAKLVERALGPGNAHLQARALEAWWAHYREHLLDTTVLFPGLRELLAGTDVPFAVHTNKPGVLARTILDGLGVLGRFVEVVGGDEAPRKPDPAGTRALLARHGAPPATSIYVGDSAIDLRTARAVPMRIAVVTWGLVPEERLRAEGADLLVGDVGALARLLGANP
jgi:phosphoglycolate phosphatase